MSAVRLLSSRFRDLAYSRRFSSTLRAERGELPVNRSGPDDKVESVLGLKVDQASVPENVIRALSVENASRSEARRLRKMRLIERFRRSESDTGSAEVQSKFSCEFSLISSQQFDGD